MSIVAWRTENVRCVELIPAGLEASTETVHEVKADSTWVFFNQSVVAWRTENGGCVKLIPAELGTVTETEGTYNSTSDFFSEKKIYDAN